MSGWDAPVEQVAAYWYPPGSTELARWPWEQREVMRVVTKPQPFNLRLPTKRGRRRDARRGTRGRRRARPVPDPRVVRLPLDTWTVYRAHLYRGAIRPPHVLDVLLYLPDGTPPPPGAERDLTRAVGRAVDLPA